MGGIYYDQGAVQEVERLEGPLTPAQANIVRIEGYREEEYLDSKGVLTQGAGLTGKHLGGTFKGAYKEHYDRAKRRVLIKQRRFLESVSNLPAMLTRQSGV